MTPIADAPRVRMYRREFGDAFLVALPGDSGRPFRMLVDCGPSLGAPNPDEAAERLARDVAATTEGRIDVLVVSHDHWSRVAGFARARAVFDEIAIGEVWLGWPEDPDDPRARLLASRRDRELRALRVLANRAARTDGRGAEGAALAADLNALLGWFGPGDGSVGRRAIERLKDHPSRPRVRYLRGGEVVRLPGSASGSAFVLGPAADAGSLGGESAALLAVAGSPNPSDARDDDEFDRSDAFDARDRIPPEQAERMDFFRDVYLAESEAWRRIDHD